MNFNEIEFFLSDIVANLLQRPDINDVAPEYAHEFELAKKFHQNCLASDLHTMRKSDEYLNVLAGIGGFPAVTSNWNASQFSWFNMSSHLSNYGAGSFINEDMITNYPFTPYYPLPKYGFDEELHDDTIRNVSSRAYLLNKMRMQTILSVYEVSEDKSQKIIDDVFQFLDEVLAMPKTYDESPEKCDELSKTLDESDLMTIVQQFTIHYDIAWKGKFKYVPANHMPCYYFYHELNKICEAHKEAVANYLAMKFLYHMDARLEDPKFQQEYCTDEIRKAFFALFDELYMKLYFTQDMANDVKSLSHGVRESMRIILQNTDSLDEASRDMALLKASELKVSVGRYEEDPEIHKTFLAQLEELHFVPDNYEANKINLEKFNIYIGRYYGLNYELFNNNTKPLPILKAMVANAFFYPIDNSMYIAAGILKPPIYHKDWPLSLKMGTLGVSFGHELGHSFDTSGSNYDHEGNFKHWWTDEVETLYEELTQCYVKHYNNYTIKEINRNINGRLTLDENIADSTGLLTAYMTYRRYVESRSYESDEAFQKDQGLPGLDVTPDQLFFLGSAQMWCSKFKETHYWKLLADDHTVPKYRVLGEMGNNKDFVKAFNCQMGDKMNEVEDKCHMW